VTRCCKREDAKSEKEQSSSEMLFCSEKPLNLLIEKKEEEKLASGQGNPVNLSMIGAFHTSFPGLAVTNSAHFSFLGNPHG